MAESAGKIISFGFSRVSKLSGPPKVIKPKETVEYIDCLQSKTIVCKKSDDTTENKTDLIIPLYKPQGDAKLLVAEEKRKLAETGETSTSNNKGDDTSRTENLEEIAVKEILEDVKKDSETTQDSTASTFLIKKSRRVGNSREATLEDYESIPVSSYGMAMLRGMGWKPGKGIGKKERLVTATEPQLRPRGLGLGADKLVSLSQQTPKSKDEEELKTVKGAFVQIINGSRKGHYGQIEGFNEDSGRVIIKLTLQSSCVPVNEYAFRLVTKEEYNKNSRVLNVSSYEEYKKKVDRRS